MNLKQRELTSFTGNGKICLCACLSVEASGNTIDEHKHLSQVRCNDMEALALWLLKDLRYAFHPQSAVHAGKFRQRLCHPSLCGPLRVAGLSTPHDILF